MLSGAVLSYSSQRGDGNLNLKGCKARLFQQRAQCDMKGEDHLRVWVQGNFHPRPLNFTHSRAPLHDREGATRPRRYNRDLTTSELHAEATRWPTALGRRGRNPGVPAASSAPSRWVSPSNQGIAAIPLQSGFLGANRNHSALLSELLGTKEEEEDSRGNWLEKEGG